MHDVMQLHAGPSFPSSSACLVPACMVPACILSETPYIGIAILLFAAFCHMSMATDKKSSYIVHMAPFAQVQESLDVEEDTYFVSSLESVSNNAEMLYTFKNVLNGFSATLKQKEADALRALDQVLSVSQDKLYQLHTTRTPAFLGLDQKHKGFPSSQNVSDVIIGVFDTGVWPESQSFNDKGLGPVPSRWKGECETGDKFNASMCNRKLVGARYFLKSYEQNNQTKWSAEYRSPRDDNGHGTHTSSTAAGSAVLNANEFNYASGTARGMATQARVAVYKVCWKNGCMDSDILAGMDKAIDDKVDVMSLSIGGSMAQSYDDDAIAIGAFAAMQKGIFVSCSAGNDGPGDSTLSNTAPWITTVGAGTLDRDFLAPITLGNKNYSGTSLYSGNKSIVGKFLPLVYAGSNDPNITLAGGLCLNGSLNPEMVNGKIVLCDRGGISRVAKGFVVKNAGGAGMILANAESNGEELTADSHLYPATAVGYKASLEIKNYLSSYPNATVNIQFLGTKLDVQPAPVVAAFSSRGPNSITPDILKPDLIAPGVNILAAWTGANSPTEQEEDKRRVQFNIISGTSMSCPHISGLAALVKAAHPKWSPAAIRSALMTTAYSQYKNGNSLLDVATGNPSTPYAHGSGHVEPLAALDPGLVYDLNATDYFNFLCALKYTSKQINLISGQNTSTCDKRKVYSVSDLNYPSFAIYIKAIPKEYHIVVTHIRRLTNVGPAGTYQVKVSSPDDTAAVINVDPKTLKFSQNETLSYTVTFSVSMEMPANTNKFGRLEWYNGKGHVVSSPIAITWG